MKRKAESDLYTLSKYIKSDKTWWDMDTLDITIITASKSQARETSLSHISTRFFEQMRNETEKVAFFGSELCVVYDIMHMKQLASFEHNIRFIFGDQIVRTSNRNLFVLAADVPHCTGYLCAALDIVTQCSCTFENTPNKSGSLYFFAVGTSVICLCMDGYAHKWDAENGAYKKRLYQWAKKPQEFNSKRVLKHIHGTIVAVYTRDNPHYIRIIDVGTGICLNEVFVDRPPCKLYCVNEHFIIYTSKCNKVAQFDMLKKQVVTLMNENDRAYTPGISHTESKWAGIKRNRKITIREAGGDALLTDYSTGDIEKNALFYIKEEQTIVFHTCQSIVIVYCTTKTCIRLDLSDFITHDRTFFKYLGNGRMRMAYEYQNIPRAVIFNIRTARTISFIIGRDQMPGACFFSKRLK